MPSEASSEASNSQPRVGLASWLGGGSVFVVLLAATVVIVGALAFFPALALGPIVEELQF